MAPQETDEAYGEAGAGTGHMAQDVEAGLQVWAEGLLDDAFKEGQWAPRPTQV